MSDCVIALDLGGTKLASALFDVDGRPIGKRSTVLGDRTGDAVAKLNVREIKRLQQSAEGRRLVVRGVGICVPGIVRPRSGRVWAPNIPGWDDYPLLAEIRAAVADSAVKVVVDSDRTASILGEVWQGAARGCRDAVFMAVGTGIGAGILVDGRIVRGAEGIAGAIGWLALERPFRQGYVECGCFESHASGNGIARGARQLLSQRKSYRGVLKSTQDLTGHDVFAAFKQGDAIAKEVIGLAVEYWGMAAANLVSLFNPEKVVFGGGVCGPAAILIDDITREAKRWAQPVAIRSVKFEASQLGGDAALYGAACLALKRSRLI